MRRTCATVVALILAVTQGSAQTPPQSPSAPPNPPAEQAPVFRASAHLVQVNVVVHDSHGQPVDDLKKEDFSITEQGKPQQISFFSMTSADKAPGPAPTLPPHIFSNVLAKNREVPTSVTVVLLDLLNTSWTDQQYARKGLLKFLEQLQPQDRVAIFSLGSHSLTLLHDYTTDSASLLARLQKATGEIPTELDASTRQRECARASFSVSASMRWLTRASAKRTSLPPAES